MYLCVCHAVTERKVRELANGGGATLSAVYRELGVRPRCATCVPFIKEAFLEAKKATLDKLPEAMASRPAPFGVPAE